MKLSEQEWRGFRVDFQDYIGSETAFMEIVKWHNGEGCDVQITNGSDAKSISLTHAEIDALLIGLTAATRS